VKPESVVIRDFSFTPASVTPPPAPVPAIKLTATSTKVKGAYTTTLKWTGATGTSVTLWINGTKKTVLNTGSFVNKFNGGSTITYKVCDAGGCSDTLSVVT
jgi:hypothetical protein